MSCWALVGIAVGWMFAPLFLLPLALLGRLIYPRKPFKSIPWDDLGPEAPPPPLTDAELRSLIFTDREIRRLAERAARPHHIYNDDPNNRVASIGPE